MTPSHGDIMFDLGHAIRFCNGLVLKTGHTFLIGILLLLPLAAGARTVEPVYKSRHHHRSIDSSGVAEKLAPSAISAIPTASRLSPARSLNSMYNPANVRPVRADVTHWFGPKAAGIRYDSRMIHAAEIAEQRAHRHSISRCWRYVKDALLAANVVQSYPKTALAKQAGDELMQSHGFRRLSINDPFKAPIGSVLVYGGRGAGHVEIRTYAGFVSDFQSLTPSKRPLLGVYVKPS